MWFLVLGLFLFLGTHALRIGGDATRERLLGRLGPRYFRIIYSLTSVLGFALLV